VKTRTVKQTPEAAAGVVVVVVVIGQRAERGNKSAGVW